MSSHSYSDIRYHIERYENTIKLSLLCKSFIDKKFPELDFFPPEENFFIKNQEKPITPDFSFLNKDKTYGVICEIKAGLTPNVEYIEKKTKRILKKYLNLKQGWDLTETSFKELNYSLLFITHFQNIEGLKTYLTEYNQQNPLKKSVSVWEFSISENQYGNNLKLLKFRHYCGKSGIEKLDIEANTGYWMLESDLNKERGKYLFTSEPPDEYTILMIWIYVFSHLAHNKNNDDKKNDEFNTTIDEVYKIIKENFMNWGGKKTLLRRSWIVKAFDKMVIYNLIQKEEEGKYKIDYKTRHKKDILELIKDKIKILDEKKERKKPTVKKPQKKTVQLKIND